MRIPRLTVKRLIGVLRDVNAGDTVRNACQRHQLSTQTFYRLRNQIHSMGAVPKQRLRYLESVNRRLRITIAELSLDYNALRAALVNDSRREC